MFSIFLLQIPGKSLISFIGSDKSFNDSILNLFLKEEAKMLKISYLCFLATLLIFPHTLSMAKTNEPSKPTIRIALVNTAASGLIYHAYERGYFADEEINVVIKDNYQFSKDTLKALRNKEVDIAASSQTAIAQALVESQADFKILATIASSDYYIGMVGRKDNGVSINAQSLKGKRIGLVAGTDPEYVTDLFLVINGLFKDDAEINNIDSIDHLEKMIENNQLDVVTIWEPYYSKILKKLGDNAVRFPVNDIFTFTSNLVVGSDFLQSYPSMARKFFKALERSYKEYNSNRENFFSVIKGKYLSDEKDYFSKIIYEFKLDQSLVNYLEDQLVWILNYKYGIKKMTLPNCLPYFDFDFLNSVKPKSVTIIR